MQSIKRQALETILCIDDIVDEDQLEAFNELFQYMNQGLQATLEERFSGAHSRDYYLGLMQGIIISKQLVISGNRRTFMFYTDALQDLISVQITTKPTLFQKIKNKIRYIYLKIMMLFCRN